MQLFVLGPAFELPSIDAECIGAIALLQRVPGDKWQLVPTSAHRERLPLLVDGRRRISGFQNIALHVESTKGLNSEQSADWTATASFLEANAQPLLDISLYVSAENYSTTRSAFTRILPWYINYILPPRRRSAARLRTEHLGVSSIDVDHVHEDMSNRPPGFDDVGKEQAFEAETQKRASLLLPKRDTIKSLLQRPEHAAVFKLHALADHFFEPLQDLLGDKKYLLGQDLTSIDCLAYGYLSLMLYPKLPQDWLASTMRRKYKELAAYVERIHRKLKLQTNVDYVVALSRCKTESDILEHRKATSLTLPWNPPVSPRTTDVVSSTIDELVSHIPLFGSSITTVVPSKRIKQPFWQQYLPALVGFTAGTLGLILYWALRSGNLIWPHGEEVHIFGRKRFSDYGHLGTALAGISLLGQQASQDAAFHAQEAADSPVQVDVAVEGDNLR